MGKSKLPAIAVAVLTLAGLGWILSQRFACNVVDSETFAVYPCLTSGDFVTYLVATLVIGGGLFFWLLKRKSA
jgi:hypothetical protein